MTHQTDTRPTPAVAEPRGSVLTDVRNVWWRETLTVLRDPFSLILTYANLTPLAFHACQSTLPWYLATSMPFV